MQRDLVEVRLQKYSVETLSKFTFFAVCGSPGLKKLGSEIRPRGCIIFVLYGSTYSTGV